MNGVANDADLVAEVVGVPVRHYEGPDRTIPHLVGLGRIGGRRQAHLRHIAGYNHCRRSHQLGAIRLENGDGSGRLEQQDRRFCTRGT